MTLAELIEKYPEIQNIEIQNFLQIEKTVIGQTLVSRVRVKPYIDSPLKEDLKKVFEK